MPAHIVSGLMFLGILATYYFLYSQYNSLDQVFSNLFNETSKRTVVNHNTGRVIGHLFTFPLEMVYHFLPWTLMVLYFIRRDILKLIRADAFITFNLLVFLSNVLVYWSSPQVYPRYLFMLAPLVFSSYLVLHQKHKAEKTWQFLLIDRLFLGVFPIIALASFSLMFLEITADIPYRVAKTIALGLAFLVLTGLYFRLKTERLLVLVLFLLVVRIGFNWFVLPDRYKNDYGTLCKLSSIEMGKKFKNEALYVYKETEMQPTNNFHLTYERQQIIPIQMSNFDTSALYIINPTLYPDVSYEPLGEFQVRHGKLTYIIGKLKSR